jgi:soluble lytic murein transglycosylase-like protein
MAAESVVLKNGFRMHVDRHESSADKVILYTDGGSLEMSPAEIDHFEVDPEPAPAPIVPEKKPEAAPAPATKSATAGGAIQSVEEAIHSAGVKYGLDPDFIRSIIRTESAGNPRAVSPKGAAGLMQLMPATAKTLGVANVFDISANVEGGTAYIRQLLDRYNHDVVRALAAYNAGPQKVESFGGIPPYRETYAYVTRVITLFNKEKAKSN